MLSKRLKFFAILIAAGMVLPACIASNRSKFVIAASKSYETSIYRQNCLICHGPEGEGRTLDDGRIVPSLRTGNFKAVTTDAIYKQISDGGNGMTPFNKVLTERELRMMAEFVQRDLRGK